MQRTMREDWRQSLGESVRRSEVYADAMRYAEKLEENGIPILFDFEHVAAEMQLTTYIVSAVLRHPNEFYRSFKVPKRSGGERTISVPSPVLMSAQRWILENILENLQMHPAATGFVKDKNITDNVRPHLLNRCLIKIDLKDFFPSISMKRVIGLFKNAGYNPKVAFYLSRMCCVDNGLPQGAPTSPSISNIISMNLDKRIENLCNSRDWVYTRYADDISISGESIGNQAIQFINKIIIEEGFTPNNKKCRLISGNGKKIITGISISRGKMCLPREKKRMLRRDAHFVIKRGFEAHCKTQEISDPIYLERLIGRLQFWRQVEPANMFPSWALEELSRLKKSIS